MANIGHAHNRQSRLRTGAIAQWCHQHSNSTVLWQSKPWLTQDTGGAIVLVPGWCQVAFSRVFSPLSTDLLVKLPPTSSVNAHFPALHTLLRSSHAITNASLLMLMMTMKISLRVLCALHDDDCGDKAISYMMIASIVTLKECPRRWG